MKIEEEKMTEQDVNDILSYAEECIKFICYKWCESWKEVSK